MTAEFLWFLFVCVGGAILLNGLIYCVVTIGQYISAVIEEQARAREYYRKERERRGLKA